jgi:hypothetical protein
MRKIVLISIAAMAVAVCAAFNVSLNTKNGGLYSLALVNIEALAETECPDPYDVPDHYIEVKTETHTVTSNSRGEISWGNTVKGGYEKNKQVAVGHNQEPVVNNRTYELRLINHLKVKGII